jgi:hypothetical protein
MLITEGNQLETIGSNMVIIADVPPGAQQRHSAAQKARPFPSNMFAACTG